MAFEFELEEDFEAPRQEAADTWVLDIALCYDVSINLAVVMSVMFVQGDGPMLTREQIVKMAKMTLARTLSRASEALPMSEKHRKRLQKLKERKEAEAAKERGLTS